jgi:hypothetical protein
MAEPTDAQLRDLYRAGVSLGQSWLKYAHPDLKARWDELAQQSAFDSFKSAGEAIAPLDMPALEKFQKMLAPANKILTARTAVRNEMEAAILRYIKAGHLFAFGFEPPRRLASVPVAIPKAAMSGKLDWDQNKVSFASLEFIEVRLTTSRYWTEIYRSVQVPDPAKPGRPTVGPDIEAAFHALHKAGEINITRSASSHYDEIRTWLAANKPSLPVDPNTLGNEVIRKNFMPLFKELKKTTNYKLPDIL